jgi:hypothetical protein
MREESHLDEMRDAIRGDFERLAERRGDQELMRAAQPDDPRAGLEDPVADEEPAPGSSVEAERRSWLARLFST